MNKNKADNFFRKPFCKRGGKMFAMRLDLGQEQRYLALGTTAQGLVARKRLPGIMRSYFDRALDKVDKDMTNP